jgi:hypothetical protein
MVANCLERADYAVTLARLWVVDRLAPLPETPIEGERLRSAFPWLDVTSCELL